MDLTGNIEVFESAADDVDHLLEEVSKIDPDTILFEASSPLSAKSCLVHVLIAKPGCPVIMISQEQNWMHVVRWETVQIGSANDLIKTFKHI